MAVASGLWSVARRGGSRAAPTAYRLPPTAYRCSGFTLVEILAVIAILGLLMGIGVAGWLHFRSASRMQEAHRQLAAAARRARVFALEEMAEGRLVLSPDRRSFHCQGLRLLGLWNFEGPDVIAGGDQPGGAGKADKGPPHFTEAGFAGRVLESFGAERSAEFGFRGKGLRFANPGTLLFVGEDFRFPAGGELSCWIRAELDSAGTARKQRLFARGKELEFFINVSGGLQGRSGSADLVTTGYRLLPGRWTQVSFFFSAEEVRIAIDGVVRARAAPGDLPNKKEESLALVFSDDKEFPFLGCLDELAVRRQVREGEFRLPADCQFEAGAPDEVRFDAMGGLDRRWHGGPVHIGLKWPLPSAPDGFARSRVSVAVDGEIREE